MEILEFLTLAVPFLLLFYFIVILFIRPSRSAWFVSLLAGLLLGVINILFDILAYNAHWWHYTFNPVRLQGSTPAYMIPLLNGLSAIQTNWHISPPLYLSPILIYGSLLCLITWRLWRGRSRWLALLFLVATPLFCIVRDVMGGVYNTSYQVWENVPAATAATIIMWLVGFAASLFLFWRLAPRHEENGDQIARSPILHKTQTSTKL